MGWSARIKTALEWARLIWFVGDVVGTIASWKLTKRLVLQLFHLSEDWASTIAWVIAAFVFFFLIWLQERKKKTAEQTQAMQSATNSLVTPTPSANLDATEFFRTSYYSPRQPEMETNVRAAATQNKPNDKESFYAKLVATGLVAYIYDRIWYTIYRSQLLALLEINRNSGLLPLAKVKAFYDEAAIKFPNDYSKVTFDEWLSYMKNNTLIIKHPSDMIEITVQGKDFLK